MTKANKMNYSIKIRNDKDEIEEIFIGENINIIYRGEKHIPLVSGAFKIKKRCFNKKKIIKDFQLFKLENASLKKTILDEMNDLGFYKSIICNNKKENIKIVFKTLNIIENLDETFIKQLI